MDADLLISCGPDLPFLSVRTSKGTVTFALP